MKRKVIIRNNDFLWLKNNKLAIKVIAPDIVNDIITNSILYLFNPNIKVNQFKNYLIIVLYNNDLDLYNYIVEICYYATNNIFLLSEIDGCDDR